jgi:hypothetical protein
MGALSVGRLAPRSGADAARKKGGRKGRKARKARKGRKGRKGKKDRKIVGEAAERPG